MARVVEAVLDAEVDLHVGIHELENPVTIAFSVIVFVTS